MGVGILAQFLVMDDRRLRPERDRLTVAERPFATVAVRRGNIAVDIEAALVIGAVAGHLTEIGFGQTFWSFVIAHGAFELSAIALAGAAGLGETHEALAADVPWRSGRRPRRA